MTEPMTQAPPYEIHGVTQRQITHWIRQGYLLPDQPPPGSGRSREWPEREVRVAQLMARLVAGGFAPAAAAEHARTLLRQSRWPARLVLPRGVVIEVSEETP